MDAPLTCDNCSRQIGKLETPRLWDNRIVCPECEGRLRAQARAQMPPPPVTAPPMPKPSLMDRASVVGAAAARAVHAASTSPPRDHLPRKNGPTNISLGTLVVVLLGGCCIWSAFLNNDKPRRESSGSTPQAPASVNDTPQGFSAWDGSQIAFARAIKTQLHDPSSFEHVSTKYWDVQGHYVVAMTYRAKNGFGALRLSTAKAECGKDGSLIRITQTD